MPSFEHRPASDFFTGNQNAAPTTESQQTQQAAVVASLVGATAGLGTDQTAVVDALRQAHAGDTAAATQHTGESIAQSMPSSMAFKPTFDAINADNVLAGANAKARKEDKSIPAKLPSAALSSDIKGLMASADAARVGDNPELQAQRNQFEHAVALSPEAEQAFAPTLDMMTGKALAYMKAMHGDGEGGIDAKKLALLGKDPSERNYAGAVGTGSADLLAVLGGAVGEDGKALPRGNTREVMVALSEFQDKILGPDVLSKDGIANMEKLFGEGGAAEGGAFGPADIARLSERKEDYLSELKPGKTADAKGLFSPLGGKAGPHGAYLEAKAQEMDTKLPAFTAEAIAAQLGPEKAAELNGKPASGIGEGSILSRTDKTIASANADGYNLSERETAQALAGNQGTTQGDRLPWNTGSRANLVDPSAPFIANANEQSMPLKAGISGTTARGMGLFDSLGADPQMARLAHMSQLNQIEAHSWHEIASAAQGYQDPKKPETKYNVSTPYSSMGLKPEQMAAIAQRAGVSFDEINRNS